MQSRPKLAAGLFTPIFAALLFGCTVVDQYSGRAITYNLEAEQAQDQALLLNIVRAYLRRPMQFTTVSTITGIASATGSIQYTLPTNVPFRPATQGATGIAAFPPLPTWMFGGSMSGGPAFTVPVLDTQEFYQGIMKAVPGQMWDLYLQANFPPDLLFNLFVQRVVVRHSEKDGCVATDHSYRCEFPFFNYVASDIEIDLFQALVDYLLWLGLMTEAPAPATVPFASATNVNIRYVGAPGPMDENHNPTAQVISPPGGAASSESAPSPRNYKLCFAPRLTEKYVTSSLCGGPAARGEKTNESTIKSSGVASVNVLASEGFIQALLRIAGRDGPPEVLAQLEGFFGHHRSGMEITIYMRNTQGMIYYLGEVVRRALNPDLGPPRHIFVKRGNPYLPFQLEECTSASKMCNYVFRLREGVAITGTDLVSIQYGGQTYSVSGAYDPNQPDLSSMTMEIVKQQIALNSSAKSLPQSSVITTVGP